MQFLSQPRKDALVLRTVSRKTCAPLQVNEQTVQLRKSFLIIYLFQSNLRISDITIFNSIFNINYGSRWMYKVLRICANNYLCPLAIFCYIFTREKFSVATVRFTDSISGESISSPKTERRYRISPLLSMTILLLFHSAQNYDLSTT